MRAETRHQLKQDAFSRVTFDAAEKTADWTVAHRTTLIVSVVAIAIVLAAVLGGWYYLSAQDEKASFELSQAVRTMDTQLRPEGSPAQPDVPSFTSANALKLRRNSFRRSSTCIPTPAPPIWPVIFSA